MSGRELTAADVPGTLPHMNCESYTAEDRCASFVFFLNHSTETLHLLEENSIPFIKYPFIIKVYKGDFDFGPNCDEVTGT